jgi:hypothetical protein
MNGMADAIRRHVYELQFLIFDWEENKPPFLPNLPITH